MSDASGLAEAVQALDERVGELAAAVDRRTRTRAVVTLAAATALALVGIVAALVVVHTQVREHADRDRASWCTVWRLLDDPAAAQAARAARCPS